MKIENAVNAVLLVCIMTLAGPGVAQSVTEPGADGSTKILTIDTPIVTLLSNAVTRPVLEKHIPSLVKGMEEDFDLEVFLGSSSLKELSIDDEHVKGFDEELLEKLKNDLALAQQI